MKNIKPKIPRNVIIIAFVALASGFGQDIVTPVLPAFLTLLGVSHAGIGLIDGLLQGATSIFRFISGIISDRLNGLGRIWDKYSVQTTFSISALGSAVGFFVLLSILAVNKKTRKS